MMSVSKLEMITRNSMKTIVSNLLIIKNLESKTVSVLLDRDYGNNHPFGVFFECVISTVYTDIQN